jgi:anion-transporting  ArsA/GET3 family ATPase
VLGSGGVGKTTLSAALAVHLARYKPAKVLVVTVDPAKRLAQALGSDDLGNQPCEIDVGAGQGRLFAATVDMKGAWDQLVKEYAPSREVSERIMGNPIYRNLSSKFIGSYDYAAVEVLASLTGDAGYDIVVVDTPPSRNALDFLDAPARLQEFFASNLLLFLSLPKRTRFFSAASKPFFLVAEMVLGNAFLSDLIEFFADFALLEEGLVKRSREFQEVMADRGSGCVLVSAPIGPSVREARRLVGALDSRKLRPACHIVNRSWPSSLFDREAEEAVSWLQGDGISELLDQHGGLLDIQVGRRTLGEMVHIYRSMAASRHLANQTGEAFDMPVFEVPLVDGDLGDFDTLELLVRLATRSR